MHLDRRPRLCFATRAALPSGCGANTAAANTAAANASAVSAAAVAAVAAELEFRLQQRHRR